MHLARDGAVVLAAVLMTAACSGGGEDPPPTSPAPPAATTAATSSASPTPTLVEPTLPPEAMAETDIGAVAFVRYWYSLVNYANRTGDEIPVGRVSDTACQTCTSYRETTREETADGTVLDGDYFVLEAVNAPKPKDGLVIVEIVVAVAAVNEVHPDGTTTAVAAQPSDRTKALVQWQQSRWVMVEIGQS